MISHKSGGLSIWRPAGINIVEPWGGEATAYEAHLRSGRSKDESPMVEADEVSCAIRRLRPRSARATAGALAAALATAQRSSSHHLAALSLLVRPQSSWISSRVSAKKAAGMSLSCRLPFIFLNLHPDTYGLQRRPKRVQMVRCQRFQPPRKLSRPLGHGPGRALAKWSRSTLVCPVGRRR